MLALAPFWLRPRRPDPLLVRLNVAALLALATAIFAMANFLAHRHPVRWHWRRDLTLELSDPSRRLIAALNEEIRITALLRPSHEAYEPTQILLQEYRAQAPNLVLEWVDPDRQLARAEQVVRQYRLPPGEALILETRGRFHVIPAAELVEKGPASPADDPAPRRFYRGEGLVHRALQTLTQPGRPAVFFLQGHGERAPDDFDPRQGYSRIAGLLRQQNLEVDTLHLGQTRAIPQNCALLIIAGPRQELAPFEVALLREYLARKGRLLVLLDARLRTGLEPLLKEWGIQFSDDVLMDESLSLDGRELLISSYADHPITAPLHQATTVFYLPRSLQPLPQSAGADKPIVSPLASCSAQGWAEFDPDAPSPRFHPEVDLPGPLPLAVAIERGPIAGVHVQIRPTRLVVVGDSDFATNRGLKGANAAFFLNAVNWLLERANGLGMAPRPFEDLRLTMNRRQLRRLFWLVAVGLPALAAAAGLYGAWRRRA